IHYSFLRPATTITAKSNNNDLEILDQKLKVQQPALVYKKSSILSHDEVRLHVASAAVQKLHQLGIEVLPNIPLICLPIFHLFRSIDNFLTQTRFRKQGDIENAFQ
ncbi:Histone-lysine N-methyltransferase SETMAR, partial [Habropoda laboriosa]